MVHRLPTIIALRQAPQTNFLTITEFIGYTFAIYTRTSTYDTYLRVVLVFSALSIYRRFYGQVYSAK